MKKAPVNESFRRKRRDNQILSELYDTTSPSALLTAIKTVDGSGSGLDADLLDGLDSTAFATAAQGALADSAVQPGDNVSDLTNDAGYITGVAWGDVTGTLSSQTDLQSALDAKANVSDVREVLSTVREYYVDGSLGSDSNDGLSSGSGAFATLQKAYNTLLQLDTNGYRVDVYIADGTYTAGLQVSQSWTGGGIVRFIGNTTTPSNVVISTTSNSFLIEATLPAELRLYGMKISSSSGSTIYHTGVGKLGLYYIEYGTCSNFHNLVTSTGAIVSIVTDYTISGGASRHFYVRQGAQLSVQSGITVTLSGTPSFGIYADVDLVAQLSQAGASFSGSATGTRYRVQSNGVINTNSGGATYFPGDAAGSTSTGGQYL